MQLLREKYHLTFWDKCVRSIIIIKHLHQWIRTFAVTHFFTQGSWFHATCIHYAQEWLRCVTQLSTILSPGFIVVFRQWIAFVQPVSVLIRHDETTFVESMKAVMAWPIHHVSNQLSCFVWYDEYQVGDNTDRENKCGEISLISCRDSASRYVFGNGVILFLLGAISCQDTRCNHQIFPGTTIKYKRAVFLWDSASLHYICDLYF